MDAPLPPNLTECWHEFLSENGTLPGLFAHPVLFPLQRRREMEWMHRQAQAIQPRVIAEIGADKGGGVWAFCDALPTLHRVAACEIRGTPYCKAFERAFAELDFLWLPIPSQDTYEGLHAWLGGDRLDVLFLDGDKSRFLQDFNLLLPLVRKGGLVFLHDVVDPGPKQAWEAIKAMGHDCTHFRDVSEWEQVSDRLESPTTQHEAWLRHWRGASCSVGMVRV